MYKVKVKLVKVTESGFEKVCTEEYLVNASSFTESECSVTEHLKPFLSGEFNITAITREQAGDVVLNDNCDKYFRCKFDIVTIDEQLGKERAQRLQAIINANSIDDAGVKFNEFMKDSISDFVLVAINETRIVEFIDVKNT